MPRIDANVILRFLTNEPTGQAEQVARLFARAAAGEVQLTVDEIVVAEVVWTLSSYYRMPKPAIAEALLQLLLRDGFECRDGTAVQKALVLFEEKNVDFADALLCSRMTEEGDPEVYSFDRDFDRMKGIRRLEPS